MQIDLLDQAMNPTKATRCEAMEAELYPWFELALIGLVEHGNFASAVRALNDLASFSSDREPL